jgi:hypothetical protein
MLSTAWRSSRSNAVAVNRENTTERGWVSPYNLSFWCERSHNRYLTCARRQQASLGGGRVMCLRQGCRIARALIRCILLWRQVAPIALILSEIEPPRLIKKLLLP